MDTVSTDKLGCTALPLVSNLDWFCAPFLHVLLGTEWLVFCVCDTLNKIDKSWEAVFVIAVFSVKV